MRYAINCSPFTVTSQDGLNVRTINISTNKNSPSLTTMDIVCDTIDEADRLFFENARGGTITEDEKEIQAYQHLLNRELEKASQLISKAAEDIGKPDLPF